MMGLMGLGQVATQQPPITRDISGWFDVASWDNTTKIWRDKSNNDKTATDITGTPNVKTSTASGAADIETIYGDTGDAIRFPDSVLPSSDAYTVFAVTRYDGGNQNRIVTNLAGGNTYLLGHHYFKAGVCYYPPSGNANTWADYYGSNWVISCGQNRPDYYETNGLNRAMANVSGQSDPPSSIGLNIKTDETSDWACVEMIFYKANLTQEEIDDVTKYLGAKYSITLE